MDVRHYGTVRAPAFPCIVPGRPPYYGAEVRHDLTFASLQLPGRGTLMAEFDRPTIAAARAGTAAAIDEGLRSYMLKVYNYMASASW